MLRFFEQRVRCTDLFCKHIGVTDVVIFLEFVVLISELMRVTLET